jgi:7,8-dihydropterin-6-yl-methyl-4-(beta-D-ribofuranosyl)aminobenzene 5'-phosphate synthase
MTLSESHTGMDAVVLSQVHYDHVGGFHLSSMDASQIERVVLGIKKAGCRMVAPCHCSGDLARSEFKKAYGQDFILVGAGKTVILHDAF